MPEFIHFNEFASAVTKEPCRLGNIEIEERWLEAESDLVDTGPDFMDPGPSISQQASRTPSVYLDLEQETMSMSVPPSEAGTSPYIIPQCLPASVLQVQPFQVQQALSTHSIGQTHETRWLEVSKRLNEGDCEMERLKGEVKRWHLEFQQLKQALERQRIAVNEEFKRNDELQTQQRDHADALCKCYVDRRVNDEVEALDANVLQLRSMVDLTRREVRRGGCVSSVAGTFLGFVLMAFAYWVALSPVLHDMNPVHFFS